MNLKPKQHDSPNIQLEPAPTHRSERKYLRPKIYLIRDKGLVEHKLLYHVWLSKDHPDIAIVSRRLFWLDEFLSFLQESSLEISNQDKLHLVSLYRRRLDRTPELNRHRRNYRLAEAKRFIRFVLEQAAGTSAPGVTKSEGEKIPSTIILNELGPRTPAILRIALGYHEILPPSTTAQVTFEQVFNRVTDHLLSYKTSAGSWNSYRAAEKDLRKLLAFIAETNLWIPLQAFTRETLEAYINWAQSKNNSASTIGRNLMSIRRLLATVPNIDARVFRRLGPKVVRPLANPMDYQDALHLLNFRHPEEGYAALRDYVLFCILLACGLRIGEALSLTDQSLFFERSRNMTFIRLQKTKNHQPHIMPLPPSLIPWLSKLQKWNERLGQPKMIFLQSESRPLPCKYDYARRLFKKRLLAAGLEPKRRLHSIRACFATTLLARGAQPSLVSKALNHESPNSIKPYDGYTSKTVNETLSTFHPYFSETN